MRCERIFCGIYCFDVCVAEMDAKGGRASSGLYVAIILIIDV